jgi:hypothetical protein
MDDRAPLAEDLPPLHRHFAATLFNRAWDLIDQPDRSDAENDEMLHAAHASRYHWGAIGVRGEWQISRVYAVLERGPEALHHAQRCLGLFASTRSRALTSRSPMRRWLGRKPCSKAPLPVTNSRG